MCVGSLRRPLTREALHALSTRFLVRAALVSPRLRTFALDALLSLSARFLVRAALASPRMRHFALAVLLSLFARSLARARFPRIPALTRARILLCGGAGDFASALHLRMRNMAADRTFPV